MKLSPVENLVAIETNENYKNLPDKIDYKTNGKTHGAPSMFGRGVVAVRPSEKALNGAKRKDSTSVKISEK